MTKTNLGTHSEYPLGMVSNKHDYHYLSAEELRNIYGGKGGGLIEMHELGLPVPPAIIIPTDVSKRIGKITDHTEQKSIIEDLVNKHIYPAYREMFPNQELTSVRSGAPVSMAGMMDTILNVGLTDESMPVWKKRLNKRTAIDCLRRYLQMMGTSYFEINSDVFEREIPRVLDQINVDHASQMTISGLIKLVTAYADIHKDRMYIPELSSVKTQLMMSIYAVVNSYQSDRARHYRKMHNLDENMGTAVCIQKMVFGNRNSKSCTGVVFNRDPFTGVNKPLIDFLPKAQGEDVVSGAFDPLDSAALMEWNEELWVNLMDLVETLEAHYQDMVDVEFTVDNGKLYILQCRVGKRSATAAFRIARDLYKSDLITREQAISRLSYEQYLSLSIPTLEKPPKEHLKGTPVCSGVAVAFVVTSPEEAAKCEQPYILVREMTDANDIIAMSYAAGVITQTGGATCHAAVVARAMNIPCIVGIPGLLDWDISDDTILTMDGGSGRVWVDTEINIIENREVPADLVDWIIEPELATDIGVERLYHTGAGCWGHLQNPICVDIQNLDTKDEFYAMLLDALTFPSAIIDPKIPPIQHFEEVFKQAIGINELSTMEEDTRQADFLAALQSIAAEYEVSNIMFLLDQTDDQHNADTFQKFGYQTIVVVHDLEDLVMCSGDLIASPTLFSVFGRDVIAKLVEMKQAVTPEFKLYPYPETRTRQLSDALNTG